jgi:N-hydroxyarylamine O-acetyltransferase
MSDFPLDAYLARIGWAGPVTPTPETLIALHRHHAFAIPFENLDSFSGLPVSLASADLVEKIIHRGRGGYCFEQNGLFLLALEAIGFHTRSLCARVLISKDNYGPRSHQITLVDFEGGHRWLADVGFGGNGLVETIPFEHECEFRQSLDSYRLVEDETYGHRLEHRLPAGWRTLYAFSLDPYLPGDFDLINYAICRSPTSIFTQIPLCIRTTASERRIIAANQFKIRTADGTSAATTLEDSAQLRRVLADQLGIRLPDDFPLPDPPASAPGMREI